MDLHRNTYFFCFIYYSIALTKLDILDTFEEIKVAIAYEIDEVETHSAPGNIIF